MDRVLQAARLTNPPTSTSLVDTAPRLQRQYPGHAVFYFNFGSDLRVDPLIAAQWYFALTSTWTRKESDAASDVDFRHFTVEEVISSARRILTALPDAYVAVAGDQVAVIRSWMPASVPADHVVGW